MNVLVLGMGHMGRALASRLIDTGHQVSVWNRTPGRADDVVSRGGREVTEPSAAIATNDVVCSSLADDDAVLAVLAPDGRPLVVPGGRASRGDEDGPSVVDMSTVAPGTARRLADLYGNRFVASPVLGGPQALAGGQAPLAVAGAETTVQRLDPLWSALTTTVRRCGTDPGMAQVVKLINNYLLMAGVATLADAVAVGQAAGLGGDDLRALLAALGTVAPALHNRIDDIVGGDHQGWFSTTLGAKDVRLFTEVGAGAGVEMPLARAVQGRYEAAAAAGWADADIAAVVEPLRGQ